MQKERPIPVSLFHPRLLFPKQGCASDFEIIACAQAAWNII